MGKRKIFFSLFLGALICLGNACNGVYVEESINPIETPPIEKTDEIKEEKNILIESNVDTLKFPPNTIVLDLTTLVLPADTLYIEGEIFIFPSDTIQIPKEAKIISIEPLILIIEKQPQDPESIIRNQLINTFRSQIGVKQTGSNTGPEIDTYLASVGFEPGYAWCGAFVGWGYQEHNLNIPRKAIWTPSWFIEDKIIPHKEAQMGDVGGIHFSRLGRIAHIVVYDEDWSDAGNLILTVEGNTNDTGSREGDGVYRKRRSKNQIKHSADWING